MYFPILATPMIFVIYVTLRRVANEQVVPLLLLTVVVLSQTRGRRALFGQHGTGEVLFFAGLFVVIVLLSRDAQSKRWPLLLYMFAGPLIFFSYNFTYRLAATMLVIVFIGIVFAHTSVRVPDRSGVLFTGVALVGLTVTGLSMWFYQTFLPQVLASGKKLSGVQVFSILFLDRGGNLSGPLSEVVPVIALSRPDILPLLGIAKYGVLGVFSVFFAAVAAYELKERDVSASTVFVAGLGGMGMLYFVARLLIGQFSFAVVFTPAVFAIAALSRQRYRPIHGRKAAVVGCVLLIAISGGLMAANHASGMVERDAKLYEYQEPAAMWYHEYGEGAVVTDVRTRYAIAGVIRSQEHQEWTRAYAKTVLSDRVHVFNFNGYLRERTTGESVSPDPYVMLDHRQQWLATQLWFALRPWRTIDEHPDARTQYNKVYTTKDMEIRHRKGSQE